tara:strand:+ start:5343 stop:5651 length:309 start_codon:yes stop_codon:yes gene_type:complete
LLNDLAGNRLLASHRVNSDDRSFAIDELQCFGNRRNLVRFFLAGGLSQRQSLVARPDTHRVQGFHSFGLIVAATGRFPSTLRIGRPTPVDFQASSAKPEVQV